MAPEQIKTLQEALRHYGMGELAEAVSETVEIAAVVERVTQTTVLCDAINPNLSGEPFKRVELPRLDVLMQFYNSTSAMIRCPASFVTVFGLRDFKLSGRIREIYAEQVRRHNAPYLKQTPAGKPEMIGKVRI
jgi:hypothetical protein